MRRHVQAEHLPGCLQDGEEKHRGEENSEVLSLSDWESGADIQWFREEKEERSTG